MTITPGPRSGDYKKGKARESKTGSINNKKRDRETPNPVFGKLSSGVAGRQEIWCSSVGRLEPTFVPVPTVGSPIQAQYKPNTSQVQAQYKPKTSPVQVQYKPNTSPVQAQYKPSTSPIKARYKPNTSPVQAQYKPSTSPIQAQYKPNTSPVQAQYKPSTSPRCKPALRNCALPYKMAVYGPLITSQRSYSCSRKRHSVFRHNPHLKQS